MTRNQFRSLVVLSMALALLASTESCLGQSGLPAPLREHLEHQRETDLTRTEWIVVAIALPVFVAGIASFVGMLRFSRRSRPLAIATTAVAVALLPLTGPTVEPGTATALFHASSMLYGAVLALAYCSPAANWFHGETLPNMPVQSTSDSDGSIGPETAQ